MNTQNTPLLLLIVLYSFFSYYFYQPFKKTKWRYLALLLVALILFGNNYAFDNPQALQVPLEETLNLSISQFNLMYTAYHLPNIFLTLLGGMIIDHLGVRFGIFTFTLVITIGQLIVAIGGAIQNYYIMLGGRIVFGIASENLIIAQTIITSAWFKGKELGTSMGIIMCSPEISSAINSFITPYLYTKSESISVPLFVGVGVCFFSFLCGLLLIGIDQYAEKYDKQFQIELDEQETEAEIDEKISFKDIKNLNGTFWILLMICTFCLCCHIPFLDNINEFVQYRFNFSQVVAGRLIMITYLIPAIVSPFIGSLVDRVGKRRLWIIFCASLYIISHLLFGLLPTHKNGDVTWSSILPLTTLGIGFSLYSCVMIPSIQYVVEQRIMGTAFGILGVVESLGETIFPLIAAQIYLMNENYQLVSLFYMGMSVFTLLFGILLYFIDLEGSKILDLVNPTIVDQYEDKRYQEEDDTNSSGSSEHTEAESKEEQKIIEYELV